MEREKRIHLHHYVTGRCGPIMKWWSGKEPEVESIAWRGENQLSLPPKASPLFAHIIHTRSATNPIHIPFARSSRICLFPLLRVDYRFDLQTLFHPRKDRREGTLAEACTICDASSARASMLRRADLSWCAGSMEGPSFYRKATIPSSQPAR